MFCLRSEELVMQLAQQMLSNRYTVRYTIRYLRQCHILHLASNTTLILYPIIKLTTIHPDNDIRGIVARMLSDIQYPVSKSV